MRLPDMLITLVLAVEGLASVGGAGTSSNMTPMLFLQVDGLDVALQVGEPLEGLSAANDVATVPGNEIGEIDRVKVRIADTS